MGDILMPAMVEGFARSKGFAGRFDDIDAGFVRTLMDSDQAVARFLFHVSNTNEGFTFHRKPYQILSPISRRLENKIPLQSYAR